MILRIFKPDHTPLTDEQELGESDNLWALAAVPSFHFPRHTFHDLTHLQSFFAADLIKLSLTTA